jgi:hypothetical protein
LFADQEDFRKDLDLQESCENLKSACGKTAMSWEQVGILKEEFLFLFSNAHAPKSCMVAAL